MGGLFGSAIILPRIELEVAFTRADWLGTPAPSCNQNRVCTYRTVNNCTPQTTPPDMGIVLVISGDYRGIATYLSWMNVGVCIAVHGAAGWTCSPAFSQLQGLNSPMPPYNCTHNPT